MSLTNSKNKVDQQDVVVVGHEEKVAEYNQTVRLKYLDNNYVIGSPSSFGLGSQENIPVWLSDSVDGLVDLALIPVEDEIDTLNQYVLDMEDGINTDIISINDDLSTTNALIVTNK